MRTMSIEDKTKYIKREPLENILRLSSQTSDFCNFTKDICCQNVNKIHFLNNEKISKHGKSLSSL